MAIRILIADDHVLLRQGIKKVLNFESDIEVVGEASDGQAAVANTFMLQPDVLLLDMNMPGVNGLETARELQNGHVKTKIIVLTVVDSEQYVLDFLRRGVRGYVLKDVEPSVLIQAIRRVAAGYTYISPKFSSALFAGHENEKNLNETAREIWRESRDQRLTSREMDVISCISKGFSNKDIAKTLFVSEKTVKNHLTNIFRKLNVDDRTQALIYVLKNHILTLE